jgi:hypothetical protein
MATKQETIQEITRAAAAGELALATRLYYTSCVTWEEYYTALMTGYAECLAGTKGGEGPPCLQ